MQSDLLPPSCLTERVFVYNWLMTTIIQFMVTKEQGVYTADSVNVPVFTSSVESPPGAPTG